ncbi:hypothetical protein HYT18_00855 [Candidatus Microgenomates bacterium]|nr:hypothetical protein [Candidatus Microgenomates bacterium]
MDKKITLKGKKIPKFKSYEEEADFWDTHSPLDYGTWKEVKLEFAKPLEHILGVRMDGKTLTQLTKLGSEMGIGPSTLVRMWIMEKLKLLLRKSKQSETSSQAILHQVKKPKKFWKKLKKP